jgi:hypothetical protein
MPSRNDVTGDNLVSRTNNDQYRSNWDRIFGKKEEAKVEETEKKEDKEEGK